MHLIRSITHNYIYYIILYYYILSYTLLYIPDYIFLETLNCYHPTIKFTAEYSWAKINFPDVTVIKKGNQLVTDLYIKPTDTHQYLHASSCHVSHCKKSIPFSQALRLNRICSENAFFDKRCNELEIWLKERGYSDKLVRAQILKARKFSRSEVLNKQANGK